MGRHRRPFVVVGGLLAVAGLTGFLWTGPLLAVREVRVDGTTILPAEQVLQVAGVARGTPLLQVDLAGAGARVADLPQVASVEVTRGWPDSVVITVVERTPVAVVEQAGRRTLIDVEGVPFDTISGAPPAGVVVLDVAEPGADDPATEAALSAIVALPDRVRERLVEVTARSPREITLRLDGGTTVLWGSGDKTAEKATVLTGLLQQIESGAVEPANVLDLSAPAAVVLR